MSTLEKVKEVVSEGLNVPVSEIKEESTFEDLGADSLDIVELVMQIEEEFDIEIKDEDVEKIGDIKSIVEYIDNI